MGRIGSSLLIVTAMCCVWEITVGESKYWPGGRKEGKEEEDLNEVCKVSGNSDETIQTTEKAQQTNLEKSDLRPITNITLKNCYR